MELQQPLKIDLSKVEITKAKETDAEEVFTIVNDAYKILVGNTGISFMENNRYLGVDHALKEINDSLQIPDGYDKPQFIYMVARYEGKIIASIRGCIEICDDGVLVCECGPIAVSPDAQGSGIGTQIIKSCEQVALRDYGVKQTQLTVVNWRTDIIPYYEKRGFIRIGEKPIS